MSNTIYKTLSCSKCGNEFTIENNNRRKTCSEFCRKSRTTEQIKKLSDIRKKYLRENPDKHPWKNKNKYISGPCEHFKNILKSKNIEFVEEYSPLLTNFYSIDIAFPNIKVGIEINGNQHYNRDKTLVDYYQERHDKIESEGWMLYEIHYSKVYDPIFIEELLSKINLREQISYDFYIKKDKSEFIGPPKPDFYDKKLLKDLIILEKLKTSNINFSKLGWVEQASKIIGITPQKVGSWIERIDKDFYSTCYQRNKFVGPPKPNSDQLREIEKYYKLKLIKETIDFTQKGWTKEASKIIGVKTNRVRSWIKKHDIEFFKIIKEKEAI